MKRILALLRRDVLATSKDALLIYTIVAPLLLAFGARFFLPAVGQATVNVVVTEDTSSALIERLADYVHVEVVADQSALEQRVLAFDDTAGIMMQADGSYTILLEGNETHDTEVLPELVLRKVLNADDAPLTLHTVDVAEAPFPFREMIGAFMALSMLCIGSMVMSLNIVEDKECRVMQALGVSPLSRGEYVLARSLLALMVTLVIVFSALWLLGVVVFSLWQMLLAVVIAALFAVLIGFVIGAISGNQIAAIANIKFSVLLFLLPAILTLLLPERFWLALAWLPTYWAFVSFRAILVEGVRWSALWLPLGVNLALSLAFIAVVYPWLRGKLELG